MLVSESSAMHQLRRRSAQKLQLDLIADRMLLEHCAPLSAGMVSPDPAFSRKNIHPNNAPAVSPTTCSQAMEEPSITQAAAMASVTRSRSGQSLTAIAHTVLATTATAASFS